MYLVHGADGLNLILRRDLVNNHNMRALVFDGFSHPLVLQREHLSVLFQRLNGQPSSVADGRVRHRAVAADFARLVHDDDDLVFILRQPAREFA